MDEFVPVKTDMMHWFDCSTMFNCVCGEQEIFMDDDEEKYTCKCGRIYRFTCKLEVKDARSNPNQR